MNGAEGQRAQGLVTSVVGSTGYVETSALGESEDLGTSSLGGRLAFDRKRCSNS